MPELTTFDASRRRPRYRSLRRFFCLLALAPAIASLGCGGGASYAAPAADFAFTSTRDLGMRPAFDLAMSWPDGSAGAGDLGGPRFGCRSDINCYVMKQCADQACLSNCDAMINTPRGVKLVADYLDCLFGNTNLGKTGACPDTGGGVCDATAIGYSQMSCSTCIAMAKMGSCKAQTQDCANDG